MVGDGAATLVARAFEASHIERPPDALDRYLVLYHERLLDHTVPYPGMIDTLDALADRMRLAVLTNKPRRSTQEILDGLGLARFFPADAVIGGDGPFARKPDPSGLRHLQAAAGVEADDALLVGDSIIDWRTARAAGTAVCIARYGFGFSSFDAITATSDDRPVDFASMSDVRLIDAPRDLLGFLL